MKVRCTYGSITDGSSTIVEGGIYEVAFDGGVTYIEEPCGQRLYFDLNTGLCSWVSRDNLRFKWFTFEEVKDQPKYATSLEVLAQVFRKMADNVEKGFRPKEGIQLKINGVFEDVNNDSLYLDKVLEYRVKPETITLKRGIEVPRPLSKEECGRLQKGTVFVPTTRAKGYCSYSGTTLYPEWYNNALFYRTKEEAIEASVALFGLEIKE